MSQNSLHALQQCGCAHIKFIQLMSYLPFQYLQIPSKPILEDVIQVMFETHWQCAGAVWPITSWVPPAWTSDC